MEPVEGHLEILDRGFGFLRSIEKNFQPNPGDTFVPAPLIQKFNLPEGGYERIAGIGLKVFFNGSQETKPPVQNLKMALYWFQWSTP